MIQCINALVHYLMKNHSEDEKQAIKNARAELCKALLLMKTPAEMENLLADLCTPAELEALVDRWRVVPLLKRGIAYRSINEITGVSVTTVGRIARFLDYGNGGYKLAYERLYEASGGEGG